MTTAVVRGSKAGDRLRGASPRSRSTARTRPLPLGLAVLPLVLALINDRVLSAALHRDMTSTLKILILLGLLLCTLASGFRWGSGFGCVVVAWVLILAFSNVLALRSPAVTNGVAIHAWAGYIYPFAALTVRWERFDRDRVARVLAWLPILSLGIGLLFELAGYQTVLAKAYTGVPRLQGSLIPAWLAGVGLIGVTAAIWLRPRWHLATALAVVDALITFATATRTETAATILVVLYMTFRASEAVDSRRQGRKVIMALSVLVIAAVFLPSLLARGHNATLSGGGSSGGRTLAWSYYYHDALKSIVFGRGIGAGSAEVPTNLAGEFVHLHAPHDSYLQLLLDTGVVGCALLLLAYGLVYRRVRAGLDSYDRSLTTAFGLAILLCAVFDNVLVAISFVVPALALLAVVSQPRHVVDRKEPRRHAAHRYSGSG